jgi:predicted nucleic acid-binding protein
MAVYFFDTSALAKHYAPENGTKWVKSLIDPAMGNDIYIARIAGAEVIAAIRRKVRDKQTTQAEAVRVIAGFRSDFTTLFQIVEITDVVVNRAMTLIENNKLTGYDGIQLATAMEIDDDLLALGLPAIGTPALTMVSADKDLNIAAGAEGLIVEDPNNHLDPDDKNP